MVETYFVTPKPNKKIREAFNLSDHVSSLLSFCLDKPANKKYLLFISRFVVQHLFFKIALINPNGITNGSFHVISVFRSLTSLSFHHEISSSRPLYPQGSYISSGHIRKQECCHYDDHFTIFFNNTKKGANTSKKEVETAEKYFFTMSSESSECCVPPATPV